MARQLEAEAVDAVSEKKKLSEEKKKLKQEQKEQRKEAKRRAKEISRQQDALESEDEGNGLVTVGATILIILLWLAVICAIIKLDIGGFGSSVLTPILKDVPVVNKILPGNNIIETTDTEEYGGYTSLREAEEQIRKLELELQEAQTSSLAKDDEITNLKAQIVRLQEFEKKQVEFQRIQTEFYEEVVYADKGPGVEEYTKYYEAMDPTTAEYLYKQAIVELEESDDVEEYAAAYSEMKPKQAAAIFEAMTDDLDLAARILKVMSAEDRGAILGVMDDEVAARLTKIMNPEK